MISEKSIMRCTFLQRGAACTKSFSRSYKKVVYQNCWLFWPLNYFYANYFYYLSTKQMLNMELNMILIALMEVSCIRYSWTFQRICWIPCNLSRWWIWQSVSLYIIRSFFICVWGKQISYKPRWLQNTGKHWNKERHWL